MCICMVTQVKVRERRLGLLRPRIKAGRVCDGSAAEGSIIANAAPYTVREKTLYNYLLVNTA